MKLFGITRVNVVTNNTLSAFRATREKTLDEAKSFTFNPDRLDIRTSLFRNFCLPTYKMMASIYENSYGIILVNSDLPEPHKNDLKCMCASTPRLFFTEMKDDDRIANVVKRIVKNMVGRERFYTYRYDDDDALPRDYIKNILRISDAIENNTVISFTNGYSLRRPSGKKFDMRVRSYPFNAFGLGIVSDRSEMKVAFNLGNHREITLPTHHDTEAIGWLSTVHSLNDSRIGTPKNPEYSAEDVHGQLQELFPQISLDAIRFLPVCRPSDFTAAT